MLSEGDTAPDFTATIQDGSSFNLQTALEDSGVILYFYPKDSTPGCTTQACDFRDAKDTFESAGWRVIGVSRDSEVSHQRFIDAQSLNFDLIVDNDTSLHELYGAWLADVEIPPARAAFEAAALPRGAAVEIVVQAYDEKCCE